MEATCQTKNSVRKCTGGSNIFLYIKLVKCVDCFTPLEVIFLFFSECREQFGTMATSINPLSIFPFVFF